MDFVDLIQEKKFLGQEFLTWAWFQSDIQSGLVDIQGLGVVEIWFEDRMMLEAGSGNSRQSVTCQGHDLDLAEARTALREGKKVSRARMRVGVEGREWHATLLSDGLELAGIKAPKTLDMDEEEAESLVGRLLDRVAVIHELTRIMDALYAQFLGVRLTAEWDERELPRIRRWLQEHRD